MGGLFSSLNTSVEALRSLQSALAVTQNNVSNANTPGYARQIALLESQPFNLSAGLAAGGQIAGNPSTPKRNTKQTGRPPLSPPTGLAGGNHPPRSPHNF